MRRAVLLLAAALAAAGCTRVRFDNATAADQPLIMFRGWRNGSCSPWRAYQPSASGGEVSLGIVWPTSAKCRAEFVAIARGHGAVARDWPASAGTDAWVDGRTLVVHFPPRRSLPVALWTAGSGPVLPDWILAELQTADTLFDHAGVGVQLDTVNHFLTSSTALTNKFKAGCMSLDSSTNFTHGAVNVYIMDFPATEVADSGQSCTNPLSTPYNVFAPGVAFVWKSLQPALAHEVGHVMGLLRPNSGHTSGQPGFTAAGIDNLMFGSAATVNDLTLGQVFRMNVDAESWWNRPGNPMPFGAYARLCPDGTWDVTRECPAVYLRR